ncbi:S-formylglutathione hydrolase [Pseudoroseicyclus tamaricis]|uniref:S-formylglutathione hydrolase n=1 Tax=Pseudoroseicyclus tamaricis TaxID=2705421 RepID=A0A6B2K443_9RHOB|nr:S-formylglutathione hydrolase [Pseudoroseicyclus tamaricis]NDV02592.1 S-formylglutathione hydrolase [Pseudoroseicyclus tamaricis]
METVSEKRCFEGTQGVYRHASRATGTEMTFGLYLPPGPGPHPVLWFLAGLTCTHENAMVKAAAQLHAAEAGLALVFPDTSPRGEGVADDEAFDMGQGAGFYVDATEEPWAPHFKMWSYIADELPELLSAEFPLEMGRQGITGHSMGGHGALTLGMGLKGRFASLSAFAPICQPTQSDWGRKQFTGYLGADESKWLAHDATHLMETEGFEGEVLVDTGAADEWGEGLLRSSALGGAMAKRGQPGAFRMQAGYDHSYFFVQSFIGEHIAFHAEHLW